MAEKDEKQTRTSVGVGNTEINRETRSSESSDSYRDRDRYDRDRAYAADDTGDYQERARRGARDLGESVRDTSRTVRRESSNILTAGCDLIGGFFIGIGEAISLQSGGRSGSRSSLSNCAPISSCSGTSEDEDEAPSRPRGGRVSTSRTEVRRTTAR